jgi:hypothetical protein
MSNAVCDLMTWIWKELKMYNALFSSEFVCIILVTHTVRVRFIANWQ